MKKILIIIVAIFAVNIKAYELSFSEWSEDYPENIEQILIRKEDRYLCYIEKRVNEEYLIKEKIGSKNVDYNDFIFTEESELSEVVPEKFEDRVINEKKIIQKYNDDDIYGLVLYNKNPKNDYYISELSITDSDNNKIEMVNDYSLKSIFDNDLNTSVKLTTYIKILFINNVDVNNLNIHINIKANSDYSRLMSVSLISKDDYVLFRKNFSSINNEASISGRNGYSEFLNREVIKYTYTDKLYKTYDIIKEIGNEYKKEDSDCEIVPESKKTFYRYVTNDYVIVDASGNVLSNSDYCIKSFCRIIYLNKKEPVKEEIKEKEIENPKTGDNINYLLLFFMISIIFLLFRKRIINLVLSNCFKKINKDL